MSINAVYNKNILASCCMLIGIYVHIIPASCSGWKWIRKRGFFLLEYDDDVACTKRSFHILCPHINIFQPCPGINAKQGGILGPEFRGDGSGYQLWRQIDGRKTAEGRERAYGERSVGLAAAPQQTNGTSLAGGLRSLILPIAFSASQMSRRTVIVDNGLSPQYTCPLLRWCITWCEEKCIKLSGILKQCSLCAKFMIASTEF